MKPKRLKKGSTVGVVSTSEPITNECMNEIKRATKRMEDLGINVRFGEFAFSNPTGYGETAKHKAQDINTMFSDPEIDGIFCAMRWI